MEDDMIKDDGWKKGKGKKDEMRQRKKNARKWR